MRERHILAVLYEKPVACNFFAFSLQVKNMCFVPAIKTYIYRRLSQRLFSKSQRLATNKKQSIGDLFSPHYLLRKAAQRATYNSFRPSLFRVAFGAYLYALLTLTLSTPALAAEKKAALSIHDKWAVLIGATDYADKAIGDVPGATQNILNLTKIMIDPNFGRFTPDHILLITESKVTNANLGTALHSDWLSKKALPNHLILLYIALRVSPSKHTTDLYLLPPATASSDIERHAVSLLGTVREIKRRTQCQNIVVVLDSLTSKADKVGANEVASRLQKIATDTGCIILCQDQNLATSQVVPGSEGATLYTSSLIELLRASGGLMPIEAMAQYCVQNLGAPGQIPFYISCADPDLGKQTLGLKPKGFDPRYVKIGHSLEKHPELAIGLSDSFKAPIKPEESKIKPKTMNDILTESKPHKPTSILKDLHAAAETAADTENPEANHANISTNRVLGKVLDKGLDKVPNSASSNQTINQAGNQAGNQPTTRQPINHPINHNHPNSPQTIAAAKPVPKPAPLTADNYQEHVMDLLADRFENDPMVKEAQSKSGLVDPAAAFSIARGGQIFDIELIESSKDSRLDALALKTLKEAKLPPLPSELGEEVQIRFRFHIYASQP
jgi:TonB family protein